MSDKFLDFCKVACSDCASCFSVLSIVVVLGWILILIFFLQTKGPTQVTVCDSLFEKFWTRGRCVEVFCVLQSFCRKKSCFGKACQNLCTGTQESSKLLLLLQFVQAQAREAYEDFKGQDVEFFLFLLFQVNNCIFSSRNGNKLKAILN